MFSNDRQADRHRQSSPRCQACSGGVCHQEVSACGVAPAVHHNTPRASEPLSCIGQDTLSLSASVRLRRTTPERRCTPQSQVLQVWYSSRRDENARRKREIRYPLIMSMICPCSPVLSLVPPRLKAKHCLATSSDGLPKQELYRPYVETVPFRRKYAVVARTSHARASTTLSTVVIVHVSKLEGNFTD